MADQVSSLSGKAGASNSRGSGGIQTYESVDLLSLHTGAETLVGKKVLLAGMLHHFESGSGTSYLDVGNAENDQSLERNIIRVVYEGEVLGLTNGSELRIWGTCAGTYSQTLDHNQDLRSFPLVKADILQWR